MLEVGLGGRLDATNVIPPPRAVAITRVAFDHMSDLGDTLGKIGGEKAGIIKPGSAVVLGKIHPEARAVIEERDSRSRSAARCRSALRSRSRAPRSPTLAWR